MCDELIIALRTCVDKDKDCFECPYYERCMNNTSGKLVPMVDAADAIEELSREYESIAKSLTESVELVDKLHKQIEELQKQVAYWQAQLTKSMCGETLAELEKPRWIPVTEEPPLKVGDDGYNGYLVYAKGYYEVADYTIDKFDNAPYFHVNGEYEPTVTHFMPLPEPPEEKSKG